MGSLNIHIEPADVVAEALLVQEGYLIMDSSRKAIRMTRKKQKGKFFSSLRKLVGHEAACKAKSSMKGNYKSFTLEELLFYSASSIDGNHLPADGLFYYVGGSGSTEFSRPSNLPPEAQTVVHWDGSFHDPVYSVYCRIPKGRDSVDLIYGVDINAINKANAAWELSRKPSPNGGTNWRNQMNNSNTNNNTNNNTWKAETPEQGAETPAARLARLLARDEEIRMSSYAHARGIFQP